MPDKWEYPWYACLGSGVSRACRLRMLDVELRQASSSMLLDCGSGTCIPTESAASVRMGASATSIRPSMHGATWQRLPRSIAESSTTVRADLKSSSSGSFTNCCSTLRGGSTARTTTASNVFQGGFLGLDNIGVFDRSEAIADWADIIDQADGTAWMAMYSLNLMRIALELALHNDVLRRHRDQVLRALCLHHQRLLRPARRGRLPVERGGWLLL